MKSLFGSLILAAMSLPFTLAAQTAPATPAPATPATAAAKAAPVKAKSTAAKHKLTTRRHHKAIKTTKPAAEKKAA